ncbi:MAG: class I SAM-dependent methyltransferase [Acidobacteriota bacterium]
MHADTRAPRSTGHLDSTLAGYPAQGAEEPDPVFQKERQADLRALRSFLVEIFVGRHVLEISCGTGSWTELLARSAASVTAVDLYAQDPYALPSFPQQFTGGLAGFCWSQVPKARLRAFLTGLHRSLAPGAPMVFIDDANVKGRRTPVARRDADGNTYQQSTLSDGSICQVLKNFPTEEELRQAVQGLAYDVKVGFLPHFWILTYVPRAQA